MFSTSMVGAKNRYMGSHYQDRSPPDGSKMQVWGRTSKESEHCFCLSNSLQICLWFSMQSEILNVMHFACKWRSYINPVEIIIFQSFF